MERRLTRTINCLIGLAHASGVTFGITGTAFLLTAKDIAQQVADESLAMATVLRF